MTKMFSVMLVLLPLLPPAESQQETKQTTGVDVGFTWKDAQTFCRIFEEDLISIRDEKENKKFYQAQGWIGLYRESATSEWKWSKGGKMAYFLTWEMDEPDDGENCAYKEKNEMGWRSDSCTDTHPYICSKAWLLLVKEEKTWEEALVHCRTLEAKDPTMPVSAYENYKYDLATLLTDEDHESAREKALDATTDEVWTGLRYLAGNLLWVGGEDVNYKDTERCPSEGFCGTLPKEGDHSYAMRSCEERRNFFCYKKP